MHILDGTLVILHMINMMVKYELDSYIVIKLLNKVMIKWISQVVYRRIGEYLFFDYTITLVNSLSALTNSNDYVVRKIRFLNAFNQV